MRGLTAAAGTGSSCRRPSSREESAKACGGPLSGGPPSVLRTCPFAGLGADGYLPILAIAVAIDTYSDPSGREQPALLAARPLLGAILRERGLVAPERLSEALAEHQATRERLGDILLRRGWIFEQELARALAYQYGFDYVDLGAARVNARDAALLDPEAGQRCRALPLGFNGDELVVAVADPAPEIVEELQTRLPYSLRLVIAEPSLVQHFWDGLLEGRLS
jgi:type II secretion system (T2SS) protein E